MLHHRIHINGNIFDFLRIILFLDNTDNLPHGIRIRIVPTVLGLIDCLIQIGIHGSFVAKIIFHLCQFQIKL